MKHTTPSSNTYLLGQYVKIFCVVSLYWIISIATVFVNKTVLNSETFKLDAPLFVTWTQCITSTVICLLLKLTSKIFPQLLNFPDTKPFHKTTLFNVLPLAILFILTISFSNLCLSYVGVSFYFVSRSLTTVFNVILTYFILGDRTSVPALSCCGVIIVGFWLGVDQESFIGTFSLKGTVYGVLGSLFLSLYSIHTKKILPTLNQHVLLLSYYNNLYSIFLFLPLIYFSGEFDSLRQSTVLDNNFLFLVIISGLFGFLIGFVTTLQIQVTSPLTHNISGTAKACAQTVLATYWYHEFKPVLWWLSNFIILFGSGGYARVKQLEMSKLHSKPILVK